MTFLIAFTLISVVVFVLVWRRYRQRGREVLPSFTFRSEPEPHYTVSEFRPPELVYPAIRSGEYARSVPSPGYYVRSRPVPVVPEPEPVPENSSGGMLLASILSSPAYGYREPEVVNVTNVYNIESAPAFSGFGGGDTGGGGATSDWSRSADATGDSVAAADATAVVGGE